MPSVFTFDQESCTVVCSPDTKLTDLSFSLEAMSNNFCGRGVYRWSVKREKASDNGVIVTGKALSKSGPLKMSQVTQLGSAVEQGLIPLDIPTPELFGFEQMGPKVARDGQNLRRKMSYSKTESVIEAHDINPNVRLANLSYGFADMVVGLFAIGVQEIKYQLALKTNQLYIRHKLTDERLIRYFQQEGTDYDIESTVDKLPW